VDDRVAHSRQKLIDLVAGIDQHRLARTLAGDDEAVFVEGRRGANLNDHCGPLARDSGFGARGSACPERARKHASRRGLGKHEDAKITKDTKARISRKEPGTSNAEPEPKRTWNA